MVTNREIDPSLASDLKKEFHKAVQGNLHGRLPSL